MVSEAREGVGERAKEPSRVAMATRWQKSPPWSRYCGIRTRSPCLLYFKKKTMMNSKVDNWLSEAGKSIADFIMNFVLKNLMNRSFLPLIYTCRGRGRFSTARQPR